MANVVKFVCIDAVIDFVLRNTGFKDLEENNMISWIGEAMSAMEVYSTLEERVGFGEVGDHRIKIPVGLQYITQIAKHIHFKQEWKTEPVCGYGSAYMRDVKTDVNLLCPSVIFDQVVGGEKCCDKIEVDACGCAVNLPEKIWYRPYFDTMYQHKYLKEHNYYQNNYKPVRLKNHTFFNSLVCKEGEIYDSYCEDSYNIVGNELILSFKEGSIAISYLRTAMDENGRPLVPDRIEFFQAIKAYIVKIKAEIKYNMDPGDSAMYRYKMDSASEWQWYCGQARSWAWMPNTIDELQNLEEQRELILPRLNAYYGMFGHR